MYLLLVIMTPFAAERFNASSSIAGLAASIFIIGSLAGRVVSGRLGGSVSNGKILFLGLILNIAVSGLYFAASSIPVLLAVRFVHGVAVGTAANITGAVVARIIPAHRKGEGIGYFSLSMVLATAVGPLVAILVRHYAGYESIFFISLLLGAASCGMAFFVKIPEPVPESINAAPVTVRKGFRLSNYFELRAVPISLVMLVAGFSYSGVLSFMTVYAAEIGLVETSSFYFLVYAAAVLLSRPFTGRLMDQKGANMIAYPALLLFAGGMFLLSQAQHGWTLLLAGAILGFGYGNFQSIAQALAIKVTPPARMGLATSTYFIFLDFGLGLGPYLLGFMVPYTGYRGLYVSMIFLILASVVLYYFMHGKRDKEISVPAARIEQR